MENKTLSCLYSKIFRNCASPYAILVYIIYILIPTSNHNRRWCYFWNFALYIFWFLHQTTTQQNEWSLNKCCISFDSYIKPQPRWHWLLALPVVYLLIPTSNHNICTTLLSSHMLYIFWFLHQTTTASLMGVAFACCISFDSYIKPQPSTRLHLPESVVYLLIPTSNHNLVFCNTICIELYIFWFLHQTTTSQWLLHLFLGLYIFWFLHQTTTEFGSKKYRISCISFDSYIKPQLASDRLLVASCCISFDSYIKPQPTDLNILIFSA